MSSKRVRSVMTYLLFCAAAELAGSRAYAINYIGEWINNYGSCEAHCSGDSYNDYNDDLINGFSSKMNEKGYSYGSVVYAGTSVWSSDIVEDQLGGQDGLYGDSKTALFVATHGMAYLESDGKQRFSADMCGSGTVTTCRARSPSRP